MKLIRTFLIMFVLLLPVFVHAQSQEQQLTVTLDPETPTPYDKVTVSLSSYSFDVYNSMIIWSIGGKQVTKGMGMKSVTVNTRGIGEAIPVSAQIVTPGGQTVNTSVNVMPQSVDLMWEAIESYTPPFYEGKTLPSEGAAVKVTAVPNLGINGKKIAPENLAYSWYLNDELVENVSGYGKQSAVFKLDYLNPSTSIKVNARSSGGISTEKTISITPHEVMPLLYTHDDLLGTDFSNMVNRRLEIMNDTTIALEPFYFSTKGYLEKSATYDWYLDGLPVTPREKTLLSLRPKENSAGSRTLLIKLSNSSRLLQEAETLIDVLFDTRN